MAGLFAVLVALSLAIAISVAYALVLRELQRINANLEQFIKLIVDARQLEDAHQSDAPIANDAPWASLAMKENRGSSRGRSYARLMKKLRCSPLASGPQPKERMRGS